MIPAQSTCQTDPWQTRTVWIEDIQQEIYGVATYRLSERENPADRSKYQFAPGQFNMLYLPGVGESAISMSGNPADADGWIHTVRVAGNVTRTLGQLGQGATLGLRGPFGHGWPVAEFFNHDLVMIAGGLGMAPLRSLIYDVINRRSHYRRVWLICGARTPDTLLFRQEFDSWKKSDIDVQLTVDRAKDNWSGQIGVVTLLMERLRLENPAETHLVACGPEIMMKHAAVTALRRGLPKQQVWISLERNMQCAVGLCGHCQLGPDFICRDGPVMRYDRIENSLSVEQL